MTMFYTDDQKLIYTAPTGTRFDPLAVHRSLILFSRGTLNDLLAAWGDKEGTEFGRAEAEENLIRVAREVFQLKPFDVEGGVTDSTVIKVLCDYLEWLEGKE